MTYSPGPQAMRDLVAAAVARGDVVVSVGGDGMLSSLAGEVARGGGTLGIVPAGRGNDFARMLGLPDDPPGQAEVLLEGEPRAGSTWLDAGRGVVLGGRARSTPASTPWPPRSSTGSAGCPARCSTPTPRSARSRRTTPARYRVVVDGVDREYEAATVVVANSRYYGKG